MKKKPKNKKLMEEEFEVEIRWKGVPTEEQFKTLEAGQNFLQNNLGLPVLIVGKRPDDRG